MDGTEESAASVYARARASAVAAASADLRLIDATFVPRCASSFKSSDADPICAAGVRLARRLPSYFNEIGWDGAIQGCPHVCVGTSHCAYINRRNGVIVRRGNFCGSPLASAPIPPPRDGKQVLIVLFGLLRYYRDGWARLQSSLILSNPGVFFDVALLTWPFFTCTDRDRTRSNDDCMAKSTNVSHEDSWLRCDGPLPSLENFTSAMEQLYANRSFADASGSGRRDAHPVRLVYSQFTHCACWSRSLMLLLLRTAADTEVAGPNSAIAGGGNAFSRPHSTHRFARGWAFLLSLGLAQRYDHVLAMRPDAFLTRPLHLESTCAKWPGLNILNGVQEQDRRPGATPAYHPEEIRTCSDMRTLSDYGVLACDPRALTRWLMPAWNVSYGCRNGVGQSHMEYMEYALTDCSATTNAARSRTRVYYVPPPPPPPASEDDDKGCVIAQLFGRHETLNPLRLRLGSLDAAKVHVGLFVNRSDQGWTRFAPEHCVAPP